MKLELITPQPWKGKGNMTTKETMDLVEETTARNMEKLAKQKALYKAAPDMLEALKLACLVMAKGNGLSYSDRREADEACLAAIAKAEGR